MIADSATNGLLVLTQSGQAGRTGLVIRVRQEWRSWHVMIIEEVYDALIEAGASENKARAAARAMTNYETRISKIESDINLLKWMAGFNLAITVAILFRVFS